MHKISKWLWFLNDAHGCPTNLEKAFTRIHLLVPGKALPPSNSKGYIYQSPFRGKLFCLLEVFLRIMKFDWVSC